MVIISDADEETIRALTLGYQVFEVALDEAVLVHEEEGRAVRGWSREGALRLMPVLRSAASKDSGRARTPGERRRTRPPRLCKS